MRSLSNYMDPLHFGCKTAAASWETRASVGSHALKQGKMRLWGCRYTIAGEVEADNNGLAPPNVNVRDAFVARPGCAPSLSPSSDSITNARM